MCFPYLPTTRKGTLIIAYHEEDFKFLQSGDANERRMKKEEGKK